MHITTPKISMPNSSLLEKKAHRLLKLSLKQRSDYPESE